LLVTLLSALAPALGAFAFHFGTPGAGLPQHLTLTALVGKNNLSSLECWALTPAFVQSTAPGTVGALSYPDLGATGDISYTLVTEHTNAGLYNAPAPQYDKLLPDAGLAA
ncbi:hypothetical protein GGX14DRAFT_428839, partial [Mycena pura]